MTIQFFEFRTVSRHPSIIGFEMTVNDKFHAIDISRSRVDSEAELYKTLSEDLPGIINQLLNLHGISPFNFSKGPVHE